MSNFIICANLTVRSGCNRAAHISSIFAFNILLGFPRIHIRPLCTLQTKRLLYALKVNRTATRQFAKISSKYNAEAPTATSSAVACTADAYVPDWTVHHLHLTSCAGMWDDRPEGAAFIVGYVDTLAGREQSELRARLPTALVVEGSIGSDMRPLLVELAKKGFRVIMPYLVGSEQTKATSVMDKWQFSNLLGERASFLLDFIGAMNLKRIDVVVGHSFGCLPILTLAAQSSLFSSIAFICPIPAHASPRWHSPAFVNNLALRWTNSVLLRPVAHLWMRVWSHAHLPALQATSSRSKQLQLVWEISLGINYTNMYGMFEMFKSRRCHLLYVYSEKDAMVDVDDSLVYAHVLGIDETGHQDLAPNENVSRHPTEARYHKLLALSTSAHFPPEDQQLCERIVNEIVLLNKFSKNKR